MAYDDYAPVATSLEDDEDLNNYAPVRPITNVAGSSPATPDPYMRGASMPPVSMRAAPGSMAAPEIKSDYQPVSIPGTPMEQPNLKTAIANTPHPAQDRYAAVQNEQIPSRPAWKNILLGLAASTVPGHMIESYFPSTPVGHERELEQAKEGAEEERAQEATQVQEAATAQKPELSEQLGALRQNLQDKRDQDALDRTMEIIKGQNQRTTDTNASREGIASAGNQTKTDIANAGNKTKENIATAGNASREGIAKLHDETQKLIASEKITDANDPDKLTSTMKTMKQQAQATLPEIDAAIDETEKVKGMLGPTAGRWNDFWQGKVGASDPAFAHYKDEINFVSTAVTLAHARGRMSNELFEHFTKMFDAGKQSPENMTQALNVAKEWLSGYANLGEGKPQAQGGAKDFGAAPQGAKEGQTGKFNGKPAKVVNGRLVAQ